MRTANRICMFMVAYKNRLNWFEKASARQYRRILPDVPIKLIVSSDVDPALKDYREALGDSFEPIRIHGGWLRTHNSYNLLCYEPWFYRLFSDYEFMLVSQLDGWIHYDAIDWWMDRDCDYIAPPYFYDDCGTFRNIQEMNGGNGGTCLRKVETMVKFTEMAKKLRIDLSPYWEDQVWSGILPHFDRKRLPKLRYYPFAEQAKFGWTSPGDGFHYPAFMFRLTGGMLPMMFHKPSREVADQYCILDTDPADIFVFSSAVSAKDDYLGLVRRINADPTSRLLVGLNRCDALLRTESGKRLLAETPCRLVTMHNETSELKQGFAGKADTVIRLRDAGFAGAHHILCLRFRYPDHADDLSVTYDGVIGAPRETAVLKSIGAPPASPTAGYQAYRILRDRYPGSRIHLVNFFGNTEEHPVNFRHKTDWEQADYAKDRLVDRVFTERKE